MTVDSISDMATRIRNAITIKKSLVTLPYTKNNEIIAKILEKEGFIHCVTNVNKNDLQNLRSEQNNTRESSKKLNNANLSKIIILALKYIGREKKPIIHALKRISKPSLRWYSPNPIPQSLGGLGIFIVSTSAGLLTDKEAREKNLGGEIWLEVW